MANVAVSVHILHIHFRGGGLDFFPLRFLKIILGQKGGYPQNFNKFLSVYVLLDYSLSNHSFKPTIWYDMLCFQFWSAMNILLGTLLVLVFSSLVATNPINGTSESEDQVGRPYAEFAVFQTFHIQMPTIILTFCPQARLTKQTHTNTLSLRKGPTSLMNTTLKNGSTEVFWCHQM